MIIQSSQIIPKFFHDMSMKPRDFSVTVINMHANNASMYFFSPNTTGDGAGVAQQTVTKGLAIIIEGHIPEGDCLVLEQSEVHELERLMCQHTNQEAYYRVAYLEWSNVAEAKQNLLKTEEEIADKFNIFARARTKGSDLTFGLFEE